VVYICILLEAAGCELVGAEMRNWCENHGELEINLN
jgi:hypothetical protein